MSGWRKRQIADRIESDSISLKEKFIRWFDNNNAEIVWFLVGFCYCDMLNELAAHRYWPAAWNFFIIVTNIFLRKSNFQK